MLGSPRLIRPFPGKNTMLIRTALLALLLMSVASTAHATLILTISDAA